MPIYIKILLFIACFLFTYNIIALLSDVRKNIRATIDLKRDERIKQKIDYSTQLLIQVSNQAKLEVEKMMQALNALDSTYDVLNLDKDVASISERVFNSIKDEVFENRLCMFSDEYLMSHIVDITKVYILQEMRTDATISQLAN